MSSMFCPRCATAQVMNRSIIEQEITGPGGEKIKLLIRTYHCAICLSFVTSESVHEHDDDVAAPQGSNGLIKDETRSIHG